jgi:DNA-binding transcriptional MerR regulator
MTTRVLTLFGEEIEPEQLQAVGRGRAAKKEKVEEENAEPEEEATSIIALEPEAGKAEKEVKKTRKTARPVENLSDVLDGLDEKKQYYSIGEVAKLFKVNTSNIRFWTNEFALKVRTTRKGDRLYTPDQIRELRTIYHLVKEKKYTISGAKERLKSQKKVSEQTLDLRDSLLQLRNRLLTIRNQLI